MRADTDDKLRQVAEAYLSDTKGASTVAVMDHFKMDPMTERRKAARWVAQAKERGFIPKED